MRPADVSELSAPWQLTSPTMTLYGLTYNGIVEVPTAKGETRALSFSADKVTIYSMVTDGREPGGTLFNNGGKGETVIVSGNVQLLITKQTGYLLGLVPIKFTPHSPPPLVPGLKVPIPVTFTDNVVDQLVLHTDSLIVPGLKSKYGGGH